MSRILAYLLNIRFVRYAGASVIALAADVALFWALLQAGLLAGTASALGYSMGILVHWLISSRKVFRDTVADKGRPRTVQKAMFVISACAGLALTTLIVSVGGMAGGYPLVSKSVAIVGSFALTWYLRSRIVFGAQQ